VANRRHSSGGIDALGLVRALRAVGLCRWTPNGPRPRRPRRASPSPPSTTGCAEHRALVRRTCARPGSGHLHGLLGRMMAVVPSPLTIRRPPGRLRLVVLDRLAGGLRHRRVRSTPPCRGLVFGAHLDLVRPERCRLGGQPHGTGQGPTQDPRGFATEVITADFIPRLQVHHKSSKAKAYAID